MTDASIWFVDGDRIEIYCDGRTAGAHERGSVAVLARDDATATWRLAPRIVEGWDMPESPEQVIVGAEQRPGTNSVDRMAGTERRRWRLRCDRCGDNFERTDIAWFVGVLDRLRHANASEVSLRFLKSLLL